MHSRAIRPPMSSLIRRRARMILGWWLPFLTKSQVVRIDTDAVPADQPRLKIREIPFRRRCRNFRECHNQNALAPGAIFSRVAMCTAMDFPARTTSYRVSPKRQSYSATVSDPIWLAENSFSASRLPASPNLRRSSLSSAGRAMVSASACALSGGTSSAFTLL